MISERKRKSQRKLAWYFIKNQNEQDEPRVRLRYADEVKTKRMPVKQLDSATFLENLVRIGSKKL